MSTLTLNRIKNFLDKEFDGKIDLSNLSSNCSSVDKEKQFRSRALAAYSLTVEAFADVEEAAESVTDGYVYIPIYRLHSGGTSCPLFSPRNGSHCNY
jgi:hypothetical protein